MTIMTPLAEEIPGFLKIALIFGGKAANGQKASLVWMQDGDRECLIALRPGLDTGDEHLTPRMKSWFTGMTEVGTYLKARHKTDEDGVTEDDIERAALTLAFPKLAQDSATLDMLKAHLDLLQDEGLIDKMSFAANTDPDGGASETEDPAPDAAEAPAADKPDADTAKDTAADDTAADTETPDAPADADPQDKADPADASAEPAEDEVSAADDDDADTTDDAQDTPTPAQSPFISRPDTGLNPRTAPYTAGYASPHTRPGRIPGAGPDDG